jgi:glucosamine--fructose-6-phosphate aminotransferase (isomerizing)
VAITGKGADPRLAADHLLSTVDQERSEAHTVSYTCALALLATLAASVGGDEDIVGELDALPDKLALLLGQESWEELASRFATRRRFYFVGGGPNTATAYEAALKMSETSYVTAMGLNCEEFLHGPWAALEPQDVVVLIAPAGPSYERCLTVARVVAEVGAALIALVTEDDREISRVAAETIAIPEVPELLSPIVTVAPLQLLSYHTAVARGTDPDTLRTTEEAHGRARRVLTR